MKRDRDKERALKIMHDLGAIITNTHVVYTSGAHGDTYINKDAVYTDAAATATLCRMIARRFIHDDVETIIAPAVGGALLVQWTAYYLKRLTGRKISSAYAERVEAGQVMRLGQKFILSRGYDKLVCGKRVLVLEDVLRTGGSVRKVTDLVRAHEGYVLGVGALFNRGKITYKDVHAPKLTSLVNMELLAWDESECPLCREGVPVAVKVGKGREYLARKGT